MHPEHTYNLFWPLRNATMMAMNLALRACELAEAGDEKTASALTDELQSCFWDMLDEAGKLEKTLNIDPHGPWSLTGRIHWDTRTYGRRLSCHIGNPQAFPWDGNFEEHEILSRLSEYIESVRYIFTADHEKGKVSARSVVLHGPKGDPVVRGRKKPRLTAPRYLVVKALIDAGPIGLGKTTLVERSVTDAVNVLKRLKRSDPDWDTAIHLPKTAGNRYRIL